MFKANTIDEEIRNRIVDLALKQLNIEYIHGGHEPDGFDCAGLVWFVYHEILDIDLYEIGFGKSTTTKMMTSTYGKINLYEEKILKEELKLLNIGDILFFHRQSRKAKIPKVNNRYPGHCGIYLGNNYFIHCPSTDGKVVVDNLEENEYWNIKLVGSKDVISKELVKR